MAVNLLLSPLYSHLLLPEQNAIIAKATIYQSFITIFISLSIDSAFSRFYFDFYKKKKLLNAYLSTIIIFIIITTLIVLIILLPFGDLIFNFLQHNGQFSFNKYGVWVLITSAFTVIQSLLLLYERNKENPISFSVISLMYFFFSLIFSLCSLIIFKMGAFGVIAGRAIAYGIITVTLVILFYKKHPFYFKPKFLKSSLAYSLPLVPYLILMVLYGNVDRIMVEKGFSSPQVLGIYTFAFSIAGAVSVILSSGQNVQMPMVYKLLADHSVENDKKINEIVKFFHFIMVSAITIGLAGAIIFINLTFAKEYRVIVEYIGMLFFAYIFRSYYILFADSLFYFKKTKWIFIITLISFLIGYVCMKLLIPIWGIPGVCAGVIIINFSQAASAIILIKALGINARFYKMSINHWYTFFVLVAYFLSRYLLVKAGLPIVYCNFFPAGVTILFSIYFFYKKRVAIKNILLPLVEKNKWLKKLSFIYGKG